MQIKIFLLVGIFNILFIPVQAQNILSSLRGKVSDESGEPVTGALVKIPNIASTVADVNGNFLLNKIPLGKHTIIISSVGKVSQQKEIHLNSGENITLNFKLITNVHQMETVSVIGRTETQEANRQAYNITAIDARALYNTTLDISGALDRVAGVRIRESGGVGSNFNLSLNGFSGNHIKYFIDGIPMDNFGSSFQINNIPINIAERVEVYKGVVPMWLGSDALGGAINIITGDRHRNYIDVSYSLGSFNTHRSVINTALTSKKGFTVQLNAFQNYSDNNYKITVDASDIYTGAYSPNTVLRRFHDTYHNQSVILNLGVVDKKFADKLLLGITLGQNYKEIQTGARMVSVFGAWHRRGQSIIPTLKYKKTDLIKGLDVTFNANYNLGYEQNIDTMNVRYDWYGNMKPNGSGGERSRTLYKYRDNPGLANAMFNYKINENHSIAISNVFTTFNRKGSDVLNPGVIEESRRNNKNILGLGYNFDVKNKWSATAFVKYLSLGTKTGNGNNTRNRSTEKFGYGSAASYFINSNFQLKASYELANRLPDPEQVFGDTENIEGNPNLKPEKSNNINLGLAYNFSFNENNRFNINLTGVYRRATDYIFTRLNQNQSKLVSDNRDGVETIGGDTEIRYSYKNWFSTGVTFTYQYIRSLQKYEIDPITGTYYTTQSPLYKNQMPNIPFLFGNYDISFSLKNIGKNSNNLNFGGNLLFVNDFWLYWPSQGSREPGDDKKGIPLQLSTDLNTVYSLKNGRYNIALEAKNITNTRLYDNFSLQKPGRGFYLNLRYFINKHTQ